MPAAADRLFFARRPPASCRHRKEAVLCLASACSLPGTAEQAVLCPASACAVMSFSAADRDIVCGWVQRVLRKVSSFCPLWSVG